MAAEPQQATLTFTFSLTGEFPENYRGFRPIPQNSRLLEFDLLTLAGRDVEVLMSFRKTARPGLYDIWAQLSHTEFDGPLTGVLMIEDTTFTANFQGELFEFLDIPLDALSQGNPTAHLNVTFQIKLHVPQ